MTQNMGFIDRVIRFIVAVAIVIAYAFGLITATWAVWTFGIIAAILIVTTAVGFCPLYTLVGISTKEPTPRGR